MRPRDETVRAPAGPGTSSADPAKLHNYSEDGLDMIDDLKPKANAVVSALKALRTGGYPRRLEDTDTRLADLVGDWRHLDEFVGDVADGFLRAGGRGGNGPVVRVGEGRLGQLGRIGYADRDAAVQQARNMANELDRLRRTGADRATMRWVIDMARRGQYDPAFAVELSKRIRARGYTDAAALIREAYGEAGRPVDAEGIAALKTMSRTLTTALDTLAGTAPGERHDPDNQNLPSDERLGRDFVHDLTTARVADPYRTDGPAPTENDLAALMRFVDPPTDVAVAIADNRMTPALGSAHQGNAWGQYGGVVSNYAAMLGRNKDAAAKWLNHGQNIEQALRRPGGDDADGGVALAGLVEAGLTHHDYGTRTTLMRRAIDQVGGKQDAIYSQYMHGALAKGVAANMDWIHDHVNWQWRDGQDKLPEQILSTHDFLREVMEDDNAARQVRAAAAAYARGTVLNLPAGEGPRDRAVEELGRVLGVVVQADANAVVEAGLDRQAFNQRMGGRVDSVVGLFPFGGTVKEGVGTANDASKLVFDKSAGDLLFGGSDPLTEAQRQRAEIFDRARLATWENIAVKQYESGAHTPGEVLGAAGVAPGSEGDFLTGSPGNRDRSILPVGQMTDAQKRAYARWVLPEKIEGGPFDYGTQARDDRKSVTTGMTDTALGDLMDRTGPDTTPWWAK